jgi:pimeloyl-ACP methyl ester carboxylesterase
VALSLGGEFAARAALRRPDLFHSLTLISPTGFGTRASGPGSDRLLRNFSNPLWSQAFYDLLVSQPSVGYFLRKSFEGPVDAGLAAYDFATAHQPGARFAPLYFISGKLFTPNVRDAVYARLNLPVMALYDRDGHVSFERLPGFAAQHPNWTAVRIPGTRGLPHFEKPYEVSGALEAFWQNVPAVQRA